MEMQIAYHEIRFLDCRRDVILRDDMLPNNSWIIMTREDFERNNKQKGL